MHVTGRKKHRRFQPFLRHYIRMRLKNHWTALLLAATAVPAWPQVRFEVASIRPSQPGMTARDARHDFHGDSFVAKAMTVGDILDMLNGYQLFRVVGGPDWMRTDRYDIAAKADRPLEKLDQRQAVMALLSDRFQLQSHQEQRDVPGIVLRAPRRPTGLKQATAGEVASVRTVNGDVIFTAVSMSRVTNYLSQMWSAPVMDETGLAGANDFELPTSRVESKSGMSWGDRVREAVEAIGFRVQNRKIPLEVTVVDQCRRPSAN
jgi:uncharacterized protein (TIGR03435 family)